MPPGMDASGSDPQQLIAQLTDAIAQALPQLAPAALPEAERCRLHGHLARGGASLVYLVARALDRGEVQAEVSGQALRAQLDRAARWLHLGEALAALVPLCRDGYLREQGEAVAQAVQVLQRLRHQAAEPGASQALRRPGGALSCQAQALAPALRLLGRTRGRSLRPCRPPRTAPPGELATRLAARVAAGPCQPPPSGPDLPPAPPLPPSPPQPAPRPTPQPGPQPGPQAGPWTAPGDGPGAPVDPAPSSSPLRGGKAASQPAPDPPPGDRPRHPPLPRPITRPTRMQGPTRRDRPRAPPGPLRPCETDT